MRPSRARLLRRRPSAGLLSVGLALLTCGCAQLLGVEEVASEGGGGGGGARGDGGGSPLGAVGAGLPTSTAESTADGGVTSTSSPSSSSAEVSSGSGSTCGEVLPPCAGAVPNTFDTTEDLQQSFDIDADKAESKDKRLQLEPEDDVHAAVKSKNPVSVAPTAGACAVWVVLASSEGDATTGLAIGPGTPSEDAYRIERRGAVISAVIDGATVGQVPHVEGVTRHLRMWFDPAGQVVFDVSADSTCWTVVAGPLPRTADEGLARLYREAQSGKSKLDDFCR